MGGVCASGAAENTGTTEELQNVTTNQRIKDQTVGARSSFATAPQQQRKSMVIESRMAKPEPVVEKEQEFSEPPPTQNRSSTSTAGTRSSTGSFSKR